MDETKQSLSHLVLVTAQLLLVIQGYLLTVIRENDITDAIEDDSFQRHLQSMTDEINWATGHYTGQVPYFKTL